MSESNSDPNVEFLKLLFLSSALVYVGVYFIYVIIIQHYSKWKRFFYDDRINHIRKTIERRRKIGDDIWGVLGLSILVNFFVDYFVLITTPNQIITKIPGFEGITLFADEKNVDMFEIIANVSRLDYFLPLTVIGVILIFILRFLWLRRIDGDGGHPGTNPLLAFMYTVFGIILIQGVLISLNIQVGITLDTFIVRLLFSAIFSMFCFISSITAVFLDRFVLRDLKLK